MALRLGGADLRGAGDPVSYGHGTGDGRHASTRAHAAPDDTGGRFCGARPVQTGAGLGYHPGMPDDDLDQKRSLVTAALVGALLPKNVPRWIASNRDAAPWKAVQRAALETLRQAHKP